jgi:hypothetical protein
MARHVVRLDGLAKYVAAAAATGAAAAAYMLYESQWLSCRRSSLEVPDLPPWLEGFSILHLSDVHAGQVGLNLRTLRKAVYWARTQKVDLAVLTGDILGGVRGHARCLELLGRLEASYGIIAVPGNHEYGLSKNPFVHRACGQEWAGAGVSLLRDSYVDLTIGGGGDDGGDGAAEGGEGAEGGTVRVWGADYITGGFPLKAMLNSRASGAGADTSERPYDILLTHRPPLPGDELAGHFSLTFAGHTHGGQIRLPTPKGLMALHREALPYIEGVHDCGGSPLVISRGVGTSFLPFRLFTRPRADLYTLTKGTVL